MCRRTIIVDGDTKLPKSPKSRTARSLKFSLAWLSAITNIEAILDEMSTSAARSGAEGEDNQLVEKLRSELEELNQLALESTGKGGSYISYRQIVWSDSTLVSFLNLFFVLPGT